MGKLNAPSVIMAVITCFTLLCSLVGCPGSTPKLDDNKDSSTGTGGVTRDAQIVVARRDLGVTPDGTVIDKPLTDASSDASSGGDGSIDDSGSGGQQDASGQVQDASGQEQDTGQIIPPPPPPPPVYQFILHTGTALAETDNTHDFALADYNGDGHLDIYFIKKANTGSNSTEVHVLNGANNFQNFLLHTGTALAETDAIHNFVVADYNRDGRPDVYLIKRSNTGSNSTEVHVLNGANNFQNFLLHTGTALAETDAIHDFVVADYNRDGHPDVILIKKSHTGTNSTEIHVLNGANNFQNFLLHAGTLLAETDDSFDFAVGDDNRDGHPDIYAIKKANTGSNSTEVHILNGANGYQSFLRHADSALAETNNTFDFVVGDHNRDGKPDVFAIKKSATGSNSTEVHILSR